jgi:hypothetical protein
VIFLLLLQPEYSKGYLTQAVELVKAAGAIYIGAAGNWQGSAFEVEAATWKNDSSNAGRRLLTFGTETSLELKIIGRTIFALHVSGGGGRGRGMAAEERRKAYQRDRQTPLPAAHAEEQVPAVNCSTWGLALCKVVHPPVFALSCIA